MRQQMFGRLNDLAEGQMGKRWQGQILGQTRDFMLCSPKGRQIWNKISQYLSPRLNNSACEDGWYMQYPIKAVKNAWIFGKWPKHDQGTIYCTFPAFLKARRGRWAVPCGQNPSYFIFNKDFFFWHPRALQIPLLFSLCIQVLSLLWASLLLIKNWAAQASYMDGIASLSGCVSCMQNSPHFQLPWGLLHTEAFSLLSVSRQLVENRLCHQRGEHKGSWPQPRHVSESHFCRH